MIKREYSHLFQPVKIRGSWFRSRICSAPNMLSQTPKGMATTYYVDYLENKAMGGCAEVVVSELPVDEYGAHHPNIFLDMDGATILAEMAAAIQQHGALACAELTHAGREAPPDFNNGNLPLGPSGYIREDGVEVIEMDEAMMNRVADKFAEAAVYFKTLGFDMVMVHGGHNWLLSQFLSPHANHRTDEYGGSVENRMRFPIMVLERVRAAVGENFPIEFRVSGSDRDDDNSGKPVEDTIALLKKTEHLIDIVHVSAGMLPAAAHYAVPSTFLPHCTNLFLAEAIKKAGVKQYVTTVGAISDPEAAEEIIASGKADFVAMARALIADPQLPNKARTGRREDIRPCLRCSECQETDETKFVMACSVNPTIGREGRAFRTQPARQALNVVVVGGGPGGMQAAVTAVERGHKATLIEKTDSLGGLLKFTDYDSVKDDLRLFKNYLIRQVEKSGASLLLNTEATPELVESLKPDAVIVATGSERVIPKIPGIENAVHALDVYQPDYKFGDNVTIIGGGLVGCELAVHLGREGKKVTIVEMTGNYGGHCAMMYRFGLEYYLKKYGVEILTETACDSIEKDGVTVTKDGKTSKIKADTVVYAVGMKSVDQPFVDLCDAAETVIIVGDARRVDKVGGAVGDAYHAVVGLA